ncbi:DUF262 domain-containing protein [Collimonas sp. H4R21]|uniref:DUF262 domain-containing protein n=1 Tax=Collimonas rhizosphaerae TaxID=3126357 RepID=A0ABU9PRN3_9BURK
MKNLDITRTLYTTADFVNWQRNETLVLSPSFQRRPVWKPDQKSFFIDTIMRGLPIPIIFLRDQKTNLKTLVAKREVIDGQQRIRTVLSFVCPEYLPDFDQQRDAFSIKAVHSKDYAGCTFKTLPNELQQRIMDYQFSVHVLPSSVDDREVLQIFARMNSTGVKLNDQELRNADYFGEFKTLSYTLSTEFLESWRQWGIFTEHNIARMDEVELTSELLMSMLKGVTGKTQTAIDKVYAEFDAKFKEKDEVERRFRLVMATVEKMGQSIAVGPFKKRTVFYALFCAIYQLMFGASASLATKAKHNQLTSAQITKILKHGDAIEAKTAPEIVLDATSLRVTHVSARTALVKFLAK